MATSLENTIYAVVPVLENMANWLRHPEQYDPARDGEHWAGVCDRISQALTSKLNEEQSQRVTHWPPKIQK